MIEEVKLVLKPFYQRREVDKTQYKEIMRKAVPKVGGLLLVDEDGDDPPSLHQVCHNKTQEINPSKIKALVERYIKQVKAQHRKTST